MLEQKEINPLHVSLDMAVFCNDVLCGSTQYLIVDSQRKVLTYLAIRFVAQTPIINRAARLVPSSRVVNLSTKGLALNCTIEQFGNFPFFVETRFIQSPSDQSDPAELGAASTAGVIETPMQVPVSEYKTPMGETAIDRQAQVEAKNGHLGQFEALIIDLQTTQIEQLVFQRGHLWERKRKTVPAKLIDYFEGNVIYLNINKSDLG